jgi:hypothetical protein
MKEIDRKKREIARLQFEISELAKDELEQAKKDGKPFDELFRLWLSDDIPKRHEGWIIHMKAQGTKDIWHYINYGEPIRTKIYTVEEIARDLDSCNEDYREGSSMCLSKEQILDFKKQLMERNIGSIDYDW